MIQAFYRYRPASFETLALLVYADGKDRFAMEYFADMMRVIAYRPSFNPPRLSDLLNYRKKKPITVDKASGFVDDMIQRFMRGGKK